MKRVLAAIIIVGVISLSGWLVYQKNQDKSQTNSSQNQTTSWQNIHNQDPTKDWKAYSSAEGKFSLRYPGNWIQADHPEYCTPSILLLGMDKNSVGKCGSESFGEISIRSLEGDQRQNHQYDRTSFKNDFNKKTIVINGAEGIREGGTENRESCAGICDPLGTKLIHYLVLFNARTYDIEYRQRPNDQDELNNFDLMVTNTPSR